MKQAERHISEGIHPATIVDGIELAKKKALEYLKDCRKFEKIDRELLLNIARTSLKTKLTNDLANQ
jgi:T-complex protein 1 subunit zeta